MAPIIDRLEKQIKEELSNPQRFMVHSDAVDPRGIKAAKYYDLLGRQIETIAACDSTGPNPTPTSSTNRITTYAYDGITTC